jgi:hypothetical protein
MESLNNFLAVNLEIGNSQAAEFWKKIPMEIKFEIDSAIERGEKPAAVNRLVCAKVGFNFATAIKFIEQRKQDLPKRIPNKKV